MEDNMQEKAFSPAFYAYKYVVSMKKVRSLKYIEWLTKFIGEFADNSFSSGVLMHNLALNAKYLQLPEMVDLLPYFFIYIDQLARKQHVLCIYEKETDTESGCSCEFTNYVIRIKDNYYDVTHISHSPLEADVIKIPSLRISKCDKPSFNTVTIPMEVDLNVGTERK